MSDKPWNPEVERIRKAMMERFSDKLSMEEIAEFAYSFAAECTAPAPQPDAEKIRLLLIRAVMEISYMHCAEVLSLVRSSEGESIIEEGMKLLGLKDLSEEELARVRAATPEVTPDTQWIKPKFPATTPEEWREFGKTHFHAATPQVAPCDHFWRTIPVSPKWSWFTECEKCKIGAPLELQAENYAEGTSEQASPTPEQFPSRSQEKRIRTMRGEKKPLDPRASPTPDKCPKCGSNARGCTVCGEVERG